MKKIIIATMFAIALSSCVLAAQNVPKARYVINGRIIENFNGSQLVGEKITSYSYDADKEIHVIFTSSYTKGQEGATAGALTAVEFLTGGKTDSAAVVPSGNSKVSPSVGLDKNSTVYVLNGKIVTPEALSAVESTKVTSVTVIKNRNHEFFKKYAEEFKKVFHAEPQAVAIIQMETK